MRGRVRECHLLLHALHALLRLGWHAGWLVLIHARLVLLVLLVHARLVHARLMHTLCGVCVRGRGDVWACGRVRE